MAVQSDILYASCPDNVIVIRVIGKGTHQNSLALQTILDKTNGTKRCPFYVFDLEKCVSMDSTFMGMIATIALRQIQSGKHGAIAIGVSKDVKRLLSMLGLDTVIELRSGTNMDPEPGCPEPSFQSVKSPQIDKANQIVHMIQAHQQLIDVDSENEIKFEPVFTSLNASLRKAREEN